MTVLNILGFFQLKNARRIPTTKSNSSYTTWHIHYATNVWCTNKTRIAAEIRPYASNDTPSLPDGSVVFVLCKAHAAPNSVIFLDAVTFIPIPGDPNSQMYEDQLPDERTSFVFAVGHVIAHPETLDDGFSSRAFSLSVSDYVRNATQASTIQAVYDLSNGRWKSTPVPAVNSCVQIYGMCRELNPSGILRVKVGSIALNLGANANTTLTPAPSTSSDTPKKHRKFSPEPEESPEVSQSAQRAVAASGTSSATAGTSGSHTVSGAQGSSHCTLPAPMHSHGGPFVPGSFNPMGFYHHGESAPFSMHPPFASFVPSGPSAFPETALSGSSTEGIARNAYPQPGANFLQSAANPYAYPMTQIPSGTAGTSTSMRQVFINLLISKYSI
ncbi:hypothetical protein MVEN_00031700 [Mycena venus]|uniref:Uncharacterized protein n=1 Tax=Mycena venus TaxID=2733690 RepID=A0A8H6Z6P8_9AGAR|nr:hypothetical protein MVEN_00031700 [Mycena venus]